MPNRTFVGDGTSKNWSSTLAWVEGIVPTAADNVIFSSNSVGSILVIDGTSGSPSLCRSMDTTGYTKQITFGASAQLNVGDGTAGAFKMTAGMTFAPNASSTVKFVSTTTGNNITSAGYTFGNLTFDGVGGSWQFQDNTAFGSNTIITLTNGTLDTNGKNMTGSVGLSSSNSNTRALTLGATNWTVAAGSTAGTWDISTSTNMTLSAASSTITYTNSSSVGTFNGGGLTYGTITCTGMTGGSVVITGANTFTTATFSSGATTTSFFSFGGNQTVTGTLTGAGNSVINRLFYKSSVKGTPRTLTAQTFTFTNIDLQDITGVDSGGADSRDLSAITGGSGNCGGNSGWTFTTPANQYWVPSGATSTGSESAVTRWANASNGTPGTGRSPLPQDTAIFDASSIDAGSRTITQDKPRIGPHNWTGATNTPAWAKTVACSSYGDITLIAGMTNSGTTAFTNEFRGTATLTSAGLTWTNPLTIDCVDGVGTFAQGDNLTSSSSLTMTSGTFSGITGSRTASITNLIFNGGTFSPGATTTLSGSFQQSGGSFVQTQTLTIGTTFLLQSTVSASTFTMNQNVTAGGTVTLQGGTLLGAFTLAATTGVTFSGSSVTLTATQPTITGTTISINGTGSTYNVKTVTGSSSLTFTTGSLNLYGTLTYNNGAIVAFGNVATNPLRGFIG